jgi:maltose-binding protein MalE
MPYASENIALIYDKNRIPVPPSTWDELLAIARSLYDPEVPMYGLVFENTAGNFYQWFPFLSAGGGYVFGFDAEGKYNPCDVGLANDGAVAGARLYQSMVEEGLIPVGVNGDTQAALIAAKSTAMVISGPWTLDAVRNAGWNYGIAKIPAINGNQPKVFAGYQGFYLSSLSANKTIAADFLLNYIATKDVMEQLEVVGGRATAFLPAASASSPDLLGFGQQGAYSVPMPFIPEMGAVWGAGGNALDLINGGTEVVSALQAAKKAILTAVGCP